VAASGARREQKSRLRSLAEQVGPPANTILGTLLSVFQIAEPYKEIKEGVEWGLENGKLIRRVGNGVRVGTVFVISRIPKPWKRRRAPKREPATAGEPPPGE
jgi:hypothetical protein